MRLFIGIALAQEAAEALARVRAQFETGSGADVRWSAPSGWHVTLQFLGSMDEQREKCVVDKLTAVRAATVPVLIEGLGFFERAGIFWAGLAPAPELLALQQFVTAAMRNCGFVPEARPYSPHITLARMKGHTGTKALRWLKQAVAKSKADLRAEFVADEFLLYESLPGPEGTRYEVRQRFALCR